MRCNYVKYKFNQEKYSNHSLLLLNMLTCNGRGLPVHKNLPNEELVNVSEVAGSHPHGFILRSFFKKGFMVPP